MSYQPRNAPTVTTVSCPACGQLAQQVVPGSDPEAPWKPGDILPHDTPGGEPCRHTWSQPPASVLILRHETDGMVSWVVKDPDDPDTWAYVKAVLNTIGVARIELIPEAPG